MEALKLLEEEINKIEAQLKNLKPINDSIDADMLKTIKAMGYERIKEIIKKRTKRED